jgi:hypothetical protein
LVVPFVLFLSLFCYFGSWSRFSTDGASVRRVFISSFQGIGVSVSMPAVVSGLSSGLHGHVHKFTLYGFILTSHRQNLTSVAYVRLKLDCE